MARVVAGVEIDVNLVEVDAGAMVARSASNFLMMRAWKRVRAVEDMLVCDNSAAPDQRKSSTGKFEVTEKVIATLRGTNRLAGAGC